MGCHVGFAANDLQQFPVATDHERRTLAGQRPTPTGPKQTMHAAVRVAQQREPQTVALIKCSLPINLIGADSHPGGVEFSELCPQVSEMTAFLRSTRGHGFRVEEQHHRTGAHQVTERHFGSVLVEKGKVVNDHSFFHSVSFRLGGKPHVTP